MANQLALTVGTETYTIPIKTTNAKTKAIILRYAVQKGMVTDGRTDQQIAEAVLRSLLKYVSDGSLDRQREELMAVQRASIEETLKTDNTMFDEPVVALAARVG